MLLYRQCTLSFHGIRVCFIMYRNVTGNMKPIRDNFWTPLHSNGASTLKNNGTLCRSKILCHMEVECFRNTTIPSVLVWQLFTLSMSGSCGCSPESQSTIGWIQQTVRIAFNGLNKRWK